MQNIPCKIPIDDRDLLRLQQFNPSVVNGFIKLYQQPLAITIRFIDVDNQQIVDKQILTLSLYQRGHKNPDTLKVEITSQKDLFLNMTSTITVETYEQIKKSNRFNTNFKQYINSMLRILSNSQRSIQGQKDSNIVQLLLTSNTGQSSTLRVLQKTEYKQLQILNLKFYPTSLQKVNQSILFRYNYKKTKLKIIENSISSIYEVLEQANPSLLQYIIRNVGLVNTHDRQ